MFKKRCNKYILKLFKNISRSCSEQNETNNIRYYNSTNYKLGQFKNLCSLIHFVYSDHNGFIKLKSLLLELM